MIPHLIVASIIAAAPLPPDLQEFVDRYDAVPLDPINLAPTGKVYGWGAGDGLFSYPVMYEATRDRKYLIDFSQHADRLLALRDTELGNPDYRGLLLPSWMTYEPYLSGQALLRNAAGDATLSFLTAKADLQPDTILRVEHIDDTRFDLILTIGPPGPDQTVRRWGNLTMDRDGTGPKTGIYAQRAFVAPLPRHKRDYLLFDMQLPGTPAERMPAAGEFAVTEGKYHQISNTGTCAFPLAYFARLVKTSPELQGDAALHAKADEYIDAVRQAIAIHDDEWRENAQGEAWYIGRLGAPVWLSGLDTAINKYNILGLAMLELGLATGDQAYIDRVTKLARSFRNQMEHLPGADAYWWSYMLKDSRSIGRMSRSWEDIGHGGVNAMFAFWCYRNGIVFERADIQRMANTVMHFVSRPDYTVAEKINGARTGQGAHLRRWIYLGAVDPRVYDYSREWYLRDGDRSNAHRKRMFCAGIVWVGNELRRQ